MTHVQPSRNDPKPEGTNRPPETARCVENRPEGWARGSWSTRPGGVIPLPPFVPFLRAALPALAGDRLRVFFLPGSPSFTATAAKLRNLPADRQCPFSQPPLAPARSVTPQNHGAPSHSTKELRVLSGRVLIVSSYSTRPPQHDRVLYRPSAIDEAFPIHDASSITCPPAQSRTPI